MKVVTGGISHETSTFTPVQTTLDSYHERFYLHGTELLETFRGTNTPIGGFIDGAEKHGFELIPTMLAEAHPSAPTPRDVFNQLLGELIDGIKNAGSIDGVLLELHGAMVVGDVGSSNYIDDAEGHILSAVRETVGPHVPILAQLDIHSNVSPEMIEHADVLIGRESYPEIDMAERSLECADVLMRIQNDGLRPTMALHRIPMYWGMNQVTADAPMNEAIAELHRIETQPGVVCGSIATCFYLADTQHMGSSVYIVTDGNETMAQEYADEIGNWAFKRRADWHYPLPSTHEALVQAKADGRFPVIIADCWDNTGGGSPGDSTAVLRTFIDVGLKDACILYIVDPVAIAKCHKAGVGATLTLDVGAKSTPLQGEPVRMTVEVIAVSDGEFSYDGPFYAGLSKTMGPSAHILQDGIHVILVSIREQPFDTAFARTLGLEPRKMQYVAVKSTCHFRAGFGSWAGQIHVVSEKSVHTISDLSFHRLGRKLYPIDNS